MAKECELPDELRLLAAFALALIASGITVPLAIRLAHATSFLDRPAGYKGHEHPTPYLGGAAVIAAFLVPALALGGGGGEYAPIILCALGLLMLGTLDDRIGVSPVVRVLIEAAAAVVLWHAGLGWSVFDSGAVDLLLTVLWVVGLVNAFNLMDNMDGATGSVAAVSGTGVAILALAQGQPVLAALVIALVGACAGFVPRNLASPSRIFLGDGGSMPIGFVLAAAVMVAGSQEGLGVAAVLAGVPLVGLPILDTALVVFSRRRRGVQILSGSRDHLTHRLRLRVPSVQAVALALALGQAGLCAGAIVMFRLNELAMIPGTVGYLLVGATAVWMLEMPPGALWRRGVAVLPRRSATPRQSESSV